MNLRKAVKKLYKTGFFHSFELQKNYLTYQDVHGNKYVVHEPANRLPYFRIGKVHEWTERGLTYESEYTVMGDIEKAKFIDHVKPMQTTNPDYILRASLSYLFN
jgi:hypothetical protein